MTLKDQFVVRFILFKIPNRKGRNKFLMQATLTHDTYVLCVYIYRPVVTPRTHSCLNYHMYFLHDLHKSLFDICYASIAPHFSCMCIQYNFSQTIFKGITLVLPPQLQLTFVSEIILHS